MPTQQDLDAFYHDITVNQQNDLTHNFVNGNHIIYFHGTAASNLQDIKNNGLCPKKNQNYETHGYWMAYAHKSFFACQNYAKAKNTNGVVIAFDLTSFINDPANEDCYRLVGDVLKSNILIDQQYIIGYITV